MDDELLLQCLDAAANLSNAALRQMSAGAQRALNGAIRSGAKVEVTITLTTSVAVRGVVSHSGQVVQLFEVTFPFEPSTLLN